MEAPIGTQEFSGDLPLVVNPFDKGKEVRLIDGGDRTNVLDWANFHIITGDKNAIRNINRSVEKAGLKTKDLVLQPLASAAAVMCDQDLEAGVAIVDIGGGGLFGTWEVNRNVLSVRQEKAMEYIIHLEKPDNLTQVVNSSSIGYRRPRDVDRLEGPVAE